MAEFVPVGITVPFVNGGDSPESRHYRSLTTQGVPATAPGTVPQGLCVMSAGGKGLEWIQVFDDEEAFLAYLDRNLAEHQANPMAKGTVAVPEPHAKDEACPNQPEPQRGSLAGEVFGRALDADGQLVALTATTREAYAMQEKTSIPRETVEALGELARQLSAEGAPDSVEVPRPIIDQFLFQAHLGPKDVKLIANPLGGKTTVAEIAFTLTKDEGGLFLLQGRSKLSAAKQPQFSHAQDLRWKGLLEVDAKGVRRVVLGASGSYSLTWRGFTDDEVRFKTLFAGRAMDASGDVRFGMLLERADEGTEQANPKASRRAGFPAEMVPKMRELQVAVQRWRADGNSMDPIARVMGAVPQLIKAGKLDEAEKRIDEALKLVGATTETREREGDEPARAAGQKERQGGGPPSSLQAKMQTLQSRLRAWQESGRSPQKIAEVMQRFGPLMEEREFEAAEKVLDEALEIAYSK